MRWWLVIALLSAAGTAQARDALTPLGGPDHPACADGDAAAVDAELLAPPAAARVIQFWRDERDQPGISLELDRWVGAVEVRWTSTSGTRVERTRLRGSDRAPVLVIGYLADHAGILTRDELAAGGHLDLFAIGDDGRRSPIAGLPDRIRADELPPGGPGTAMQLLGAPAAADATDATAPLATAPAKLPNPFLGLDAALEILLGLGVAGALVLVALLRGRHALREL